MAAIGVFLIWAGYAAGIWGYCLLKSYDVPFTALFAGTWTGPTAASRAGQVTANALG